MNDQWSPEEQRLSAALNKAAEKVTPGPDGLAQIRRRTGALPWWRRPVILGVTAGVATAAAAIVVAVNVLGPGDDELSVQPADSPSVTHPSPSSDSTAGPADPTGDPTDPVGRPTDPDPNEQPTDPDDPGDSGEPEPEPDPDPDPEETDPPEENGPPEQFALPVYYTIDGRVTREWHSVTTADPLVTAAEQALRGSADDPRYASLWTSGEVVSAGVVDDVIEVNLASPVELNGGPELAEEAVQQLVYTLTATASHVYGDVDAALPVQVLVDGEPPADLFGELDLTEPVTRDDEVDVRYFVQVDAPVFGAEVTNPVTVKGVAAAHEANLLWELRQDGEVVDSGNTSTGEAFTFSEFSIELGDLEPGSYEITVSEADVSGGEGRDPFFETKTFTVVQP